MRPYDIALVWYTISDWLLNRKDVLIGYAYIARGENSVFYKHACRNVNYAPLYPTLVDQSDELEMT